MITIINATNRPNNQTGRVVDAYLQILQQSGETAKVLNMSDLPADFIFNASFGRQSPAMAEIVSSKIDTCKKMVIISPEYNGSYPGVLKAFFDAVHPKHFFGKRAALVGVASGRAGNLRGMDHLTDVLHHLGVEVLSLKVPISKLDSLLDVDKNLSDEPTLHSLKKQVQRFLEF